MIKVMKKKAMKEEITAKTIMLLRVSMMEMKKAVGKKC